MTETILQTAGKKQAWLDFLEYKLNKHHLSRHDDEELREFIEKEAYLPLCQLWEAGRYPSQYPLKRTINKQGSRKKRIVYSFPGVEGILLKFIAFHLYRYDWYFCDNCYAFRRDFGVWEAMHRIRSTPSLSHMYCLKVDISNYFNSINVDILLKKLSFIQATDLPLYKLFEKILKEKRVCENTKIFLEEHGAMAGTPISPFFANIYLRDVDIYFKKLNIPYFRYSDDILIFAETLERLTAYKTILYEQIASLGLCINPDKVHISVPGEPFDFLGFRCLNGQIDLSDATLRKTKAKIKRKADALRRWSRSKGLSYEKAAIGLIRAMNHKFYGNALSENISDADNTDDANIETTSNDFTWSRWFFPNLTTDKGLKIIDSYLQEYIRYTVTGRHYKGNYRIRYEHLKEWGYRSLVHEYYSYNKH